MTVKNRENKRKENVKTSTNDFRSKTEWAARLLGHGKHPYLYDKSPPSKSCVSSSAVATGDTEKKA